MLPTASLSAAAGAQFDCITANLQVPSWKIIRSNAAALFKVAAGRPYLFGFEQLALQCISTMLGLIQLGVRQ